MDNEKRKAERHFNDQAINPGGHQKDDAWVGSCKRSGSQNEGFGGQWRWPGLSRFRPPVELGYLVEAVSGLCGPHLRLLTDIADALYAIDEGQETTHKVGSKH